MPLSFSLDPKPLLSFAHPNGLTAFAEEETSVSVMLSAGVAGLVTVTLHCLADEVAFRVGQVLQSKASFQFHCPDPDANQLLQLQVILVCTDPSDQDLLIRFDAQAVNPAGQTSPPIEQLRVTLKPRARAGRPIAPTLPSETPTLTDTSNPGPGVSPAPTPPDGPTSEG